MANNLLAEIKNNVSVIKDEIAVVSQDNTIGGKPLDDFIYHRFLNRIDPIEYCENVLRGHLPEKFQKLHENQIALIRAVCNPKLKMVAGMMSRQAGKCFAKGTKILMADRTIKKVEDIVVGDKVLSPYGEEVNVIALGRGKETMYKVCGFDNSHYTVNKSHILSLMTKDFHIINIEVKDYLRLDKSQREQLFGWRMSKDLKTFSLYRFMLVKKSKSNYYGFTLDSQDKLFLLDDFTVVHNTESISSFCGFLIDNFPVMRIGIFTPRLQQAEVSIGRLSTFFQMNEDKLNHKIVKLTKDKIELDNGSFVSAVSASDQSNIEGLTFDVIVLDEAQKVSDYTWSERIVPMGGACVLDNSEIQLLDGTTKTIEEIVQNQSVDEIPCIDFDTKKLTKGKITDYHDVGIEETITITLASGKKVGGTYQHPVIMKNRANRTPRWERLDKIKVGYQVGVPKSLPFFGDIHNPYARLLGMMIGDGCCTSSAQYCTQDQELINYINSLGFEFHEIPSKCFTTKNNKICKNGTIVGFAKHMKQAGIFKNTSLNKTLPVDFEKWDKTSLQELIGGLYDTDGHIRIEENRRCRIEFSSICQNVIKDVQKILCKFGIHAYIQERKEKPNHLINGHMVDSKKYYVLHIKDKESVENFYHNIKLLVPHKQKALENGFKILQNHKCKIPKNLIDTDLRFEKVVKVEFTGKHHVYDLTVDKHHSFIANNIFVHNTNAKLVKIGTPKTRNHFYDCVEGKASDKWTVVKRDWTMCAQSWALGAIYLPDPETGIVRPYSKFIVEQAMPKALKQEMFPNNPEVWTEGNLDIEDFRTQYMLEFIDGAGKFLTSKQVEQMQSGEYDWLDHGIIGEKYVAGIDFAGANPEGDATQISILRINRDGTKHKVFGKEFKDASYPEQMYYIAGLLGGANPRFHCSKIFADYTGCGAAVVQTLQDEYGMRNIEGIIFNSRDKFTNSGMNMKNAMYGKWRTELDNNRFFYPTKERFLNSPTKLAGKDNVSYYMRMISEWADLEQTTTGFSVNKKIEAPSGYHDDVCDADVLANFAATSGQRSSMPKPSRGRYKWR